MKPKNKDGANELGTNKTDLEAATNDSGNNEKNYAAEETDPELNNDEDETEEVSAEELEAARQERWTKIKESLKNHSVEEDIAALFSGETLSEEFRTKATTIFEAAVISRAVTVAEEMEKEILEAAEEAVEETREELEEQINTYLNFVVENWVKENEVAIETGLRSEIVENFISGLKNLFVEHYVEIPSEQVDVVEAQASEIERLEAEVNESINTNIELTKRLNESKKKEIIQTVCEGLTATQAEKIKTLTESVEFTTEGEYKKKVDIIRENYVAAGKNGGNSTQTLVEATENGGPATDETINVSDRMEAYVRAISASKV